MNHHQGWFSSKDSDVVCMVGLEGVYYELLLEKQSIISNKSCSQLDKLKAILEQKASGISQQKTHTLPSWWRKTACFLDDQAETYILAGKFWFICYISQTLHLQISIYFSIYKILLMEKVSIPWKTVEST